MRKVAEPYWTSWLFGNIKQLIWILVGGFKFLFSKSSVAFFIWKVTPLNEWSNYIRKILWFISEWMISVRNVVICCSIRPMFTCYTVRFPWSSLCGLILKTEQKKIFKKYGYNFLYLKKWIFTVSATCHTTPTIQAWVDRYFIFFIAF